jgi:hypothetical protein
LALKHEHLPPNMSRCSESAWAKRSTPGVSACAEDYERKAVACSTSFSLGYDNDSYKCGPFVCSGPLIYTDLQVYMQTFSWWGSLPKPLDLSQADQESRCQTTSLTFALTIWQDCCRYFISVDHCTRVPFEEGMVRSGLVREFLVLPCAKMNTTLLFLVG